MDYKLLSFVLFSVILTISCKDLENAENATSIVNVAEGLFRTARAQKNSVYANMISCAFRYDTACFVDAAGEYFERRKNELLAQADLALMKSTARADPEQTPSHVVKSIEKLLSELSGIFKDGLMSFFNARESENDDEVVDPEDDDNSASRAVNGEARKKKKKKGIKSLITVIKIGILAAVVAGKIALLVKIFEAALKFKFLLIAGGSFLINALKFWFEMKGNKQHDDTIVYKNPYEHGGDWSSSGPPGEYSARAYDTRESSQNLAYKGHKPI